MVCWLPTMDQEVCVGIDGMAFSHYFGILYNSKSQLFRNSGGAGRVVGAFSTHLRMETSVR